LPEGIGESNSAAPTWSLLASVNCKYPNGDPDPGGTGPTGVDVQPPRTCSPGGGAAPRGAPVRQAAQSHGTADRRSHG
jgi:hypothetical protein